MGAITTAFVKQFGMNIDILSQQKGSKLRNAVRLATGLVGEDAYIDQLDARTAQEKTTRNSDVNYAEGDYERRKISAITIYDATLIDKEDKLKMLIDPTSAEAQNIAYALGRKIDDKLCAAAFGTAYYGKAGDSSETFPAANVIAVGAAGLTLAKLLDAKEILDNYDVDEDEPRYIAVTGTQLKDLLNTTEVKSADYNTVRALVQGQVDTFCGFKFIRLSTGVLDTDSSSYRRVIAWAQNGLGLGIWRDMTARLDEIPGKHYAVQVYAAMDIGVTRLDSDKVVEIKCSEA